jgi:hypothetical protein
MNDASLAVDALGQVSIAPGAPWWFQPVLVVGVGCFGGWVLWEFVKRTITTQMDGRKPPNFISIIGGAVTAGALSYGAGNLSGLAVSEATLYALTASLFSPVAFPVMVLALAVAAEKIAGPGWGQRVRTTLMGRERERRSRARSEVFTEGVYPSRERREQEETDDQTIFDKTRAWWNG